MGAAVSTPARVSVLRSAAGACRWELATRPVIEVLRPFVRDYCGYVESTAGPFTRRELPHAQVVVIFELGPPIRVFERGTVAPAGARRFTRGFVAGIDDTYTITSHEGFQSGIQLNLTPLGARRFFRIPMNELSRTVIGVDDLLPAEHRAIAERLSELPSWETRFDYLERFVATRVVPSDRSDELLAWAYRRIDESDGALSMDHLATELGYSHKHMIELFKDGVGLPPKQLARLVRFERLIGHLKSGAGGSWAELAARFGYADQSHLIREVRHFSGVTPREAQVLVASWPSD